MKPRPGQWGETLASTGDVDLLACSYRGQTYTFSGIDAVVVGVSLPMGAIAYLGIKVVIGHLLPMLPLRVVTTAACVLACVGCIVGGLPLGAIVATLCLVVDAYRIERDESYGVSR